MDVNFEYYKIFYYVAKYHNFTKAAQALNNSQPNITRAMNCLEQQLNTTLFIRTNRGVQLTPEGERLYSHVAIAYDHLHAAELELENEKKLEQGTVTIGVSEIALHLLLLPVLGEFRRKYPKIRLRISSYTAPQAIQTVRNGLSDFAVASTPAEVKKPLKAIPLLSFKEILVANAAYKDMFKEPVSLKKLVEYPFICLGKNTSTYDFYTRFFLEHGIAMTADTEAATIDQILPMVEKDDTDTLTEAMKNVEGEDYVTLFTCTPYGVNSHRLLVRGHSVPYNGEDDEKAIANESMLQTVKDYYMLYAILAVAAAILITVLIKIIRDRKVSRGSKEGGK